MSNKPTLFFFCAAIFALVGMVWGIQMSATQDHSLSPAHGHLNLLGFVAMAIFGTYYALSPSAAASRLAWVHFGLSVLSVLVLVPGIVLAISGKGEMLAKLGSVLAVLAMVIFAINILRHRISN